MDPLREQPHGHHLATQRDLPRCDFTASPNGVPITSGRVTTVDAIAAVLPAGPAVVR